MGELLVGPRSLLTAQTNSHKTPVRYPRVFFFSDINLRLSQAKIVVLFFFGNLDLLIRTGRIST